MQTFCAQKAVEHITLEDGTIVQCTSRCIIVALWRHNPISIEIWTSKSILILSTFKSKVCTGLSNVDVKNIFWALII
jgi:hypothetical protein